MDGVGQKKGSLAGRPHSHAAHGRTCDIQHVGRLEEGNEIHISVFPLSLNIWMGSGKSIFLLTVFVQHTFT